MKHIQNMKWSVNKGLLAAAVSVAGVAVISTLVYGLTSAGTVIRNQATATYLDSANVAQTTSSNQVSTTVQEVLGVTLVNDQTKFAVENSTVYFAHYLTNVGNDVESYTVCLDETGFSDDFDTTLQLYLDEDGDGFPDDFGSPLSSVVPATFTPTDGCYEVGTLDAGESAQILVQAVIADESPDLSVGDQSLYEITAYSDTGFDNVSVTGVEDSNTDTIEITDGPIVEVIKSIDTSQGPSGSGPYQITLTYRNNGLTDAQDLRIEEILPITTFSGAAGGMTYVAGSASWSHESVTSTTLTDADETDTQTDSNGLGMLFCAYDSSCDSGTAPLDFFNDRIVAVIDSVPAGEEGVISFQIQVDSGIEEDEVLLNSVNYIYYDPTGPTLIDEGGNDFVSNTVTFTIIDIALNPDVVANDTATVADTDNVTEGANDALDTNNLVYEEGSYDGFDPATSIIQQGDSGLFYNYIWNNGDGEDIFDITLDNVFERDGVTSLSNPFPAGTKFEFLKTDGVNYLIDTDGDSTPDTGPLDPGEAYLVVLRITPPAMLSGDNSGNGWETTVIATSSVDETISNSVSDLLSEIPNVDVDLTNAQVRDPSCDVATPAASCNGEGAGPYASPANSYLLNNGETSYIPLWVHNLGGAADAYDLAYSDSNFVADSAPAGITIAFFSVTSGATTCDGNINSVIFNSGNIDTGDERLVCAAVTPDLDYIADGSALDLYFRVLSDTTGAVDIKYDQITVTQAPALNFEPEHEGQVGPGQFINYPHLVTNTGNTALECLNVVSADSLSADNWNSQIYLDVDEDSALDLNVDVPLTDQTLQPGEKFRIIVKVFAPANAPDGFANITTLPLAGYIDNNDADPAVCSTAPADLVTVTLEDTTTVSNSNLIVVKSQSLDANCDGTSDSGTFVTTTFQVNPAQCVIYQLTSNNIGVETLFDLLVKDLTPTFTSYETNGEDCSVTMGGSGTPDSGTPGDCSFVSALLDGDTGEVQVGVDYLEAGGSIRVNFSVKVD